MLDSIAEEILKGVFSNLKIEGHPFLSNFIRGLLIGLVLFLFVCVFNDLVQYHALTTARMQRGFIISFGFGMLLALVLNFFLLCKQQLGFLGRHPYLTNLIRGLLAGLIGFLMFTILGGEINNEVLSLEYLQRGFILFFGLGMLLTAVLDFIQFYRWFFEAY